jgi:hypothetical protein
LVSPACMGLPQLSGQLGMAQPNCAKTETGLTVGKSGNRYGEGHGALLSHR